MSIYKLEITSSKQIQFKCYTSSYQKIKYYIYKFIDQMDVIATYETINNIEEQFLTHTLIEEGQIIEMENGIKMGDVRVSKLCIL